MRGGTSVASALPALPSRRTFSPHDVNKVGREHKRRALALDAKLELDVAEKVAKVNVEKVAVGLHHDVVVVAVSNAKHVRRHTVA